MKKTLTHLLGPSLPVWLAVAISALAVSQPKSSPIAAEDAEDAARANDSPTSQSEETKVNSFKPEKSPRTLGADVSPIFERSLPDSQGSPRRISTFKGTKATVFLFVSTECPISNGYLPTLASLAEAFEPRGVSFVLVNSNDGQSLKQIATHRKEFAVELPVLKDAGASLAESFGVAKCPEAAIVDSQGILVYRGRIDDRYNRRGGSSGKVTQRDLRAAIDSVILGQPLKNPETPVVGCPIVSRDRTMPAANAANNHDVTWSGQVASLMQQHCQRCHRSGGVGPFSLESYEQAVSWADDIKSYTKDRTMPPWLPAEGYGDFHNRRSLTESQIQTIGAWVDAGCPRGDSGQDPAKVAFPSGWTLGTPDLVLEPNQNYEVAADGGDVYRCFVLPTGLTEDRFVKAIEVLPGNARVVHHVIAFLDTTDQSARLDANETGEGYSTSAGFPGFLPSGGLGGWAPGNQPRKLPDGMGKPLPKGATVVMQVHYHKSGKPEVDRTRLGLYLSKEKITRAVRTLPVMPFGGPLSGMKIPAGEANHEVRATVTLPKDLQVITVTPHMHLIGKDMKLTAMTPAGDEEKLLWVKRWDFNWQESYQYREPFPLPRGTQLELIAHFDNSAENPNNPSSPPKLVKWGEQTTDEMCIAFLEVVPKEEARTADDLKPQRPGELIQEAIGQKLRDAIRNRLGRPASENE